MAKLIRGSDWNSMDLASIGITLVLAIGMGSGLGWWIGGKLGNQTIGLIVGFIMGTAAGFIEMFRAVSRWNRRMERQEQVENSSDKIGVHENRACPDSIGDRNGADQAEEDS